MTRTDAPPGLTFALAFSIAAPLVYLICEAMNWPLFTYHPGPAQFDWGFAPAMRDMGPAMYWYGWLASAILGGAVLGRIITALPARWTQPIPLALVWLIPTLAAPWLVHALTYYWRK